MSYAILRVEKLKSRVSLAGALKHNYRENHPANADPEREKDNLTDKKNSGEALREYSQMIPEKVRKNAVHALEFVITASPEFFEKATRKELVKYFKDSEKWVGDFVGSDNVISAVLHMDEKTPHMHFIAIPLVNGKLNAREIIGGTKHRMRWLQDDFYKNVGKHSNLERGVSHDRKRHTAPKEFGRIMAEKEAELDTQKKLLERTPEGSLSGRIAKVLHGLNETEQGACWGAFKDKAAEIRSSKKLNKPKSKSRR